MFTQWSETRWSQIYFSDDLNRDVSNGKLVYMLYVLITKKYNLPVYLQIVVCNGVMPQL